ncbi:hypothetical protein GALMADRAFT_258139 [Galerina marginata CBS 339.88]|uniref:Uncharacterized protein n=1 Tax=Galerina marginata (strain CBS 339.88) TaxID=685588 RepID=A0A067SIJ2_GALM3|nr:hypothetical protein GALMADRAFT_258139 [Galerina marginata CBS 339.88]
MPCLFCGNIETPGIFKPHYPCQLSDGEPCAPCKEVQELEPQIEQAKDALHKMLIRHRELRTRMNHSHNPIIQQVPTEVVARIFELCVLEPLGASYREMTKNERRMPLIIGSVCRVWRQIAFSTPQIWTSISIHLGNRHRPAQSGPTYYTLAEEWLSRSRDLPLSVHVYGDEHSEEIRLLELLSQHSSRWECLDLALPYRVASCLQGDSRGTSILRRLQLYCEDDSSYRYIGEHSFSPINMKLYPTSVSLISWPLKRANIEWTHATHVDLLSPDFSDCAEVLRRAPQLTYFEFTDARVGIFSTSVRYTVPTTPFPCPLLQELHIGVSGENMIEDFFNSFTLPGLEVLAISGSLYTHTPPTTNRLISFIKRSSCRLTSLSLAKGSISKVEMVLLLQEIPFVRTLRFTHMLDVFLCVLKQLAVTPRNGAQENGCILPVLESLSFHGSDISEEPFPWSLVPEIFAPLSEIQGPHQRPLRKFDISFDQKDRLNSVLPMDEASMHHFLELKKAGVALSFKVIYKEYAMTDEPYRWVIEELDLLELSIEHHGKITKPGSSESLS